MYVATVNNSVDAFDTDSANEQAAFWQVSLTAPSARPVNKADMTGACGGFLQRFLGQYGYCGHTCYRHDHQYALRGNEV